MYKKIALGLAVLALAFFFFARSGNAQGYYNNPYDPYGYGYTAPYDSDPYDYPYDYPYGNYGFYYQTPPWGYYGGGHEWREHEEHEHHGFGHGERGEHHEHGEHHR